MTLNSCRNKLYLIFLYIYFVYGLLQKAIEEDLACLPEGSCNDVERISIFRKHVREDKNGYVKTFGLGIKVPRSRAKRCALEEERVKRIKSEDQVKKMAKKLDKNTKIMIKVLELQVL